MQIKQYFTEEEMECRCGCGLRVLNLTLLKRLTAARIIFGLPIDISSWCRCPKRNQAVGGSPDSQHLFGRAVDLICYDSLKRMRLLDALLKAGFVRIGIGAAHIHGDVSAARDQKVIWLEY